MYHVVKQKKQALLSSDVAGGGADGAGGINVAFLPKVHEAGPARSNGCPGTAPYTKGRKDKMKE